MRTKMQPLHPPPKDQPNRIVSVLIRLRGDRYDRGRLAQIALAKEEYFA